MVPESAEGASMYQFIEGLIKTELGDLNPGMDLGIERTHRALTPKSIVVRFVQFPMKEKILYTAWKKKILVEEKIVFFFLS